ncbi:MAG: AgmX/PglI C-terminal domain-containing protein [Deltaproteobacteria bacterium]|nr:AgmX/PglI C-terminal domain-containing protein [Deltaproteobacteria bacterium]
MQPRNLRLPWETLRHPWIGLFGWVALCTAGGCSKKAPKPDDAFTSQWRELSSREVFYIEDDGGQGLMGRVPRGEHLPDKTGMAAEYDERTGADLHPTRPPVPVAPRVAATGGQTGGAGAAATAPLPEALTFSEVSSVVRRNLGGVRVCYLKLTRSGSSPSGRAIVSFSVEPAGKVGQVRVDAPVFQDTSLPNCVSEQVKHWSFPQTQKGGATVQYPLVFVGG